MNANLSPSPAKKKNTTLIVVGVIVGICLILVLSTVLLFGAVRRLMTNAVSTDPAVAAEAAHQIADYDLPPGYVEQISMSLATYQFVMIGPIDSTGGPLITLAQFGSSTLSAEEMERQLSQPSYPSGISPVGQFHVVETLTMTIRGFDTQVVISEGAVEGGLVMRQLTAVFPGKGGQAMLMIQGMTDSWDEQAIDDFIASIR